MFEQLENFAICDWILQAFSVASVYYDNTKVDGSGLINKDQYTFLCIDTSIGGDRSNFYISGGCSIRVVRWLLL